MPAASHWAYSRRPAPEQMRRASCELRMLPTSTVTVGTLADGAKLVLPP